VSAISLTVNDKSRRYRTLQPAQVPQVARAQVDEQEVGQITFDLLFH